MEMLKIAAVVLYHPTDAFYLIKRNRGKKFILPSIVLILSLVITRVLFILFTNYTVAEVDLRNVDMVSEIAVYSWVLFSWAIASYAISAIMSGSTFFSEALYGTALAAMPLIVFQIPIAMSTWVMGNSEKVFLDFMVMAMWVWTIFLVFRGVMVMNEYSFGKTIGVCLISVIFIVIFWSVLLMLVIFTRNLIDFASGLFQEFTTT